ncbi:MAG: hypothetical protein JJU46_12555 [Balneolaceae bacterium]|nr:hypothetical protein [Balneolaceae bacterium]MCH8547599.1 hypothetical protein [Balneolaceae bacterium]
MKNSDLIFELLDISKSVPLTVHEMAEQMVVTFHPVHQKSERLNRFSARLKEAFIDLGVTVLPWEEAFRDDEPDKVKEGVIIIEQGEGADDQLAIRKVSSLYHNPVVNIMDASPPIPENPTLQETLDSIVGVLAWNLAHVPIFLEEDRWTICTMNGAVIECNNPANPKEDILHSLIPKLAAQVMPPKRDEIIYRENKFDAEKMGYSSYINDFMEAAKIWRDNGLMLAHTSIEDLEYRNRFYKRIVSQYLDHRTGMSYGFLVKQLPTVVKPAMEGASTHWKNGRMLRREGEKLYATVFALDKYWKIEIPDIWLLSTRSGCNKTDLNPRRDILRLGLKDGEITLDVPPESSKKECRPSYDTYAILAHATGNLIVASILKALHPDASFTESLQENGLSISHWHGYPNEDFPLPGYTLHGFTNPPVSCSTPQSAAYAFNGKFVSMKRHNGDYSSYRGDIHVEPHHGTNITGSMTLAESASWVDEMHEMELPAKA